jgi:prepilin-type N-terminal cleavage/methylation domain-containing protein
MSPSRRGRPGFRLIELVVVLAIIGVLVGLLMPAAVTVHGCGGSTRTQCMNNLRQLGLAANTYASLHNNVLPALTSDAARPEYGAYNGGLLFTLLPYIEEEAAYETATRLSPQVTWAAPLSPGSDTRLSAANSPRQAGWIKVFVCPADATAANGLSANQTKTNAAAGVYPWAASSYAANYQLFGIVNDLPLDGATVTAERNNACVAKYRIGGVPDGLSNTVMFGEQLAACGSAAGNLWAYPGIGIYAAIEYAPQPAGPGIVNAPGAPGATTSYLWAPVFANSHPQFGFASGGCSGSIYLHNANAADADPPPPQIREPYAAGLYWDAPPQVGITRSTCDKSRLQSLHLQGVQVAMGDASVRALRPGVSQPTWYSASKPDDGVPLGEDW